MTLVVNNVETDTKLGASYSTDAAADTSLVSKGGQDTDSLDIMDSASGLMLGRALCTAQAGNIKRSHCIGAHIANIELYDIKHRDNFSVKGLDLIKEMADEDDDEVKLDICALQFDTVSFAGDPEDDELTSLAWLQDANLLRNITAPGYGGSPLKEKENDGMLSLNARDGPLSKTCYNPLTNANEKPPYSFSCLIFMAIEESRTHRLPVNDIYNWISSHFPFFKTAPVGWRNSVRHNLSLNKCFRKVEKICEEGVGKGSSWCIDPLYRPNLLQALKRTPYHPYHQLQMTHGGGSMSSCSPSLHSESSLSHAGLDSGDDDLSTEDVETSFNIPRLDQTVPLLRRIKCSSKISSVTSADDLDVANTLASLSKAVSVDHSLFTEENLRSNRSSVAGQSRAQSLCKFFGFSELVCTPIPSEDHAYTIPASLLNEAKLVWSNQINRDNSDSRVVEDLDLNEELIDVKDDKSNNFNNNCTTSRPIKALDFKRNVKLAAVEYNMKNKKPKSMPKNKKIKDCPLALGSRVTVRRRKRKFDGVVGINDTNDIVQVEDIGEVLEISQVVQEKYEEEVDDETRRLHEGVHALLNLASSGTRQCVRRSDVASMAHRADNVDYFNVQNKETDKNGRKKHERSKLPNRLNLKKKKIAAMKKAFGKKSEIMNVQLLVSAVSKNRSVKIVGKNSTIKTTNIVHQKKYNKVPCIGKQPKAIDASKNHIHQNMKSLRSKRAHGSHPTASLKAKQLMNKFKLKITSSNRIKLTSDESQFRRSCRIRKQD